jgi:hypothetical protein
VRTGSFDDFFIGSPWDKLSNSSRQTSFTGVQNLKNMLSQLYDPNTCFVSGVNSTEDTPTLERVVAAHIWPKYHKYPPAHINIGTEDARNGMFLLKDIEVAFDHRRVCFLCDPFHYLVQFRVLDPSLMRQKVLGSLKTFGELDHTIILFDKACRPSFRYLGIHCRDAVQYAVELPQTWITKVAAAEFDNFCEVSTPPRQDSEVSENVSVNVDDTKIPLPRTKLQPTIISHLAAEELISKVHKFKLPYPCVKLAEQPAPGED